MESKNLSLNPFYKSMAVKGRREINVDGKEVEEKEIMKTKSGIRGQSGRGKKVGRKRLRERGGMAAVKDSWLNLMFLRGSKVFEKGASLLRDADASLVGGLVGCI